MHIRSFRPADEQAASDLLVETFRPYFEDTYPALMHHDAELVAQHHGDWEREHQRMAQTLHSPADDKFVAVAVDDQENLHGFVAWHLGKNPQVAVVEVLAVSVSQRGQGLGKALLEYCFAELRLRGAKFVEIGTGGDDFHAPARRLYEGYGFRPIPVTVYQGRI